MNLRFPSLNLLRVLASPAVIRAIELGWRREPSSYAARRYFRFRGGPGRFEVAVRPDGSLQFTVGDTTTTYVPAAVQILEQLAKVEPPGLPPAA